MGTTKYCKGYAGIQVCGGVELVVGENWAPSHAKIGAYSCRQCWAAYGVIRRKHRSQIKPDPNYRAICGARYRHRNGEHYGCNTERDAEMFDWDTGVAIYYDLCKECCNLWAKYRINRLDRERLLIAQDYKCWICGKKENGEKLHVDHLHGVKGIESVRGLLCGNCNRAIGLLQENPEFFARAVKYLAEPPAQQVFTVKDYVFDQGPLKKATPSKETMRMFSSEVLVSAPINFQAK